MKMYALAILVLIMGLVACGCNDPLTWEEKHEYGKWREMDAVRRYTEEHGYLPLYGSRPDTLDPYLEPYNPRRNPKRQ